MDFETKAELNWLLNLNFLNNLTWTSQER